MKILGEYQGELWNPLKGISEGATGEIPQRTQREIPEFLEIPGTTSAEFSQTFPGKSF